MRWLLSLIVAVLLPLDLFGSTFDITIGRSGTTAPDTVTVNWSGVVSADSMAVWWDMNGAPDGDSIGVWLGGWTGAATGNHTVYDTMPEGHYIWFGLMKRSGGSWTQEGTDSLYLHDKGYTAFPRIGFIWWSGKITDPDISTIATYDIAMDNNVSLLGFSTSRQTERIARWDSVRAFNPEMIVGTHEYLNRWNLQNTGGENTAGNIGDIVGKAFLDTMRTYVGSYMPWYFTGGMRYDGLGSSDAVIKVSTIPTYLDSLYPVSSASERIWLMAWAQNTNAWEWMRLDDVWNSGGQDSIGVVRNRMNVSSGPAKVTLGVNGADTVWIGHGAPLQGSDTQRLNDVDIKGIRADVDTFSTGEEPYEVMGRLFGQMWGGITNATDGDTMINNIMWDVFYPTHPSHNPNKSYLNQYTQDDSALIYGAAALRNVWPDINISGNMKMAGLNGMENDLVNFPRWGESELQGVGRWSNERDLAYETLARIEAGRYRYQMRSDNWPNYYASVQGAQGGNIKSEYRHNVAITNMFDAYTERKSPGATDRLDWLGGLWVNSNGIAIRDTAGSTAWDDSSRWWLEWPIEPVQFLLTSGAFTDTIVNGDFEAAITRWTDSGAGVSITRTARSAKYGSWGLEIATNIPYAGYGTSFPQAQAWNEYARYDLGTPNGIDVRTNTAYTLHFWSRIGGTNFSQQHWSRIAWVRLRSSEVLYSTAIHIPRTWKEYYIPVWIASATDTTDVTIDFGLEEVLLSDHADTLYFDDLSLTLPIAGGPEFVGYYRRYDNGMLIASMVQETVTVTMPDPESTYIRIKYATEPVGDTLYTWSDSAHNDSSVVSTTLSLPPEDAFFLFGSPPTDTWPPDTVRSASAPADSITSTRIFLEWAENDSLDTQGYRVLRAPGSTAPVSPTSGGTGDTVLVEDTSGRSDTTSNVTGLPPNTQQSFSIFAVDEAGNYSGLIAESKVTATTNPAPSGGGSGGTSGGGGCGGKEGSGWSSSLRVNQPLDAQAVDTTGTVCVGSTDMHSLEVWLKTDANVGSPDVKVEYQFWVMGAGWAYEDAGQDLLIASYTSTGWRWIGIDIPSTSDFEVPGAADSLRFICTGNPGNGSDIDIYVTVGGRYK